MEEAEHDRPGGGRGFEFVRLEAAPRHDLRRLEARVPHPLARLFLGYAVRVELHPDLARPVVGFGPDDALGKLNSGRISAYQQWSCIRLTFRPWEYNSTVQHYSRQRSAKRTRTLVPAAVAVAIGLASFGMVVAANVRTSGPPVAAPNAAAATSTVSPASEPPKPTGDPGATGERLPDNRDEPTAQERADALAIFFADPRVISLVAGQTYEVLGVGVARLDKAVDTGHRFMGVGVALYGANETWGGFVDLQSRRLTSLERRAANAGLSPAEEDRAFTIAQADPQVAALISQLNAARNLAHGVPDGEGPAAECARERCANVTFNVPGGKALIVAVSLSSGRVLTIYPRR